MKRCVLFVVAVVLAGELSFADSVPAAGVYDVCVVGGGVAGVAAALQAGRAGARVVLVEQGAQVGGNMTIGGVTWPGLFHAWGRQVIDGCGWALVTNSVALAGMRLPDFSEDPGVNHWKHQVRINPALWTALAEEELVKAGVEIRYHAAPTKASGDGRGWRVETSECGEEHAFVAKVLVDATGNGTLAALCGAKRMRERACQPGGFTYLLDPHADVKDLDIPKLDRMRRSAIAEGRLEPNDICRGMWFLIHECNAALSGFAAGPDHGTTIANYVADADNSTGIWGTDPGLGGCFGRKCGDFGWIWLLKGFV